MLKIECTDGEILSYLGNVTAEIQFIGLPESSQHSWIFLVVPDTKYSEITPAIIGTNVLLGLLDECRLSAVSRRILLKPNETIGVPVYADQQVRHPRTFAFFHETCEASIPTVVDVSQGIVDSTYGRRDSYTVTLYNWTTNNASVEPKAIIFELQPVTIPGKTFKLLAEKTMDEIR